MVSDIRDFESNTRFDVIVLDRTLHMLDETERGAAFTRLLKLTRRGSHVLIADEPSNIPALKSALDQSSWGWTATLERRGFLFVQRT